MTFADKIKVYFVSSLFNYGFLHYPRDRKKEIVRFAINALCIIILPYIGFVKEHTRLLFVGIFMVLLTLGLAKVFKQPSIKNVLLIALIGSVIAFIVGAIVEITGLMAIASPDLYLGTIAYGGILSWALGFVRSLGRGLFQMAGLVLEDDGRREYVEETYSLGRNFFTNNWQVNKDVYTYRYRTPEATKHDIRVFG